MTKKRIFQLYKTFIYLSLFNFLFGQISIGERLYHIPPTSPIIGETIFFKITTPSNIGVVEAFFLYKMNGEQSYNEKEMELLGDTWSAAILSTPKGEKLEYFFIFKQQDGSELFFQGQHTHLQPHMLSVTPNSNNEINDNNSETNIIYQKEHNFLILSPSEDDIVYSDNVLIMVSLYNIKELDINSINIYIDNQDVTAEALITPEIITYAPQHVDPGAKTLFITASTDNGKAIFPLNHTILVLKTENNSKSSSFKYSAKGHTELITDRTGNEKLNIGLTDLILRGGWPRFQFQSRFKITTDESPFKQPKNRYSATVQAGRHLKIKLGDFAPSITPYTIKGKRLRGMGIDLRLGWIRFQLLDGVLERAIQGLNDTDQSYKLASVSIDTTGKTVYELDRYGYTFRNDINSYRLALNIKDRIIFGTTLMKVKNDYSSIEKELPKARFTVLSDTTIDLANQINSGIYTLSEFQQSIYSAGHISQLTEKGWGGPKPQENLVIGTDFKLLLNRQKFLLEGYFALSLINKDIWDGSLTLAELDTIAAGKADGMIFDSVDTLGLPNPQTIEDYITINLNLVPLIPIDFNLFRTDPAKAIKNMPASAYNLKLRLLYFNNFFEVQYLQVGPEFNSLGNPYFPRNIREISIIDKTWFFNRRLQTSINYKTKTNDILETNSNPYHENSIGINLNYIPGINQPTSMYSHQKMNRKNSIANIDTLTITIDSSLTQWDTTYIRQDLRVDLIRTNNFFTVSLPIKLPVNLKNGSYWIAGTFNSIINTDLLEKERPDSLFLSQSSSMRLLSLVFGARYKGDQKLILNISNFINNHKEQGKTQLNSASITKERPIIKNKINLLGTFSFLSSSGISEFSNFGLSLGSTIIISQNFRINLSALTRARSTSSGTEISNFAVKLSTSYIF